MWTDVILGDPDMPTVSARVYRSAVARRDAALVLHLHGGAFAEDRTNVERPAAIAIAESGANVFSIDYGAASQNSFPRAMEIAFAALKHLDETRRSGAKNKARLLIAGEEAGGNIAAAVSLRARDQLPGALDGQVLLSPLLDPCMASVSMREAVDLGMRQTWAAGWAHYLGTEGDPSHPYAAPGNCTRFANVAPTLVLTSQNDPLRDETLNYAARLRNAGVDVTQHVLPARTGWPSIYSGKTDEPSKWSADLSHLFGSFVQELH
ncbi:alpha/beta hydrolase fold domain-containing protein [Rhizobium sp. S152]|uniref:alpha/beta hydrolase fold domain-containing protein n=1 Tax=Rhizobium sp. S152 TaxID=3055038 RepID=UPI0025A960DF|nr:alpha/beta hydrolase fold domain-containing protein [Rhizobium sp. S152]MDM9628520.1 alpha/beta hydrolase fold domain-containing protein [Rhizobium sp. S152]